MAGGFTGRSGGLPALRKLATLGRQDSHRQLHNRLGQPAQLALPGRAIACGAIPFSGERQKGHAGRAYERAVGAMH